MNVSARVLASSQRFHHISRPLKAGEPLPQLPTLIEQIMACRMLAVHEEHAAGVADEIDEQDEYGED